MPLSIDRRAVLRAAGIGLVLPMLESVGAFALPRRRRAPASRFVAVGVGLGLHTPALFPARSGRDYDDTPLLAPLEAFRGQYTLFSGLDHNGRNGHPFWRTFLTGPEPESISLDQELAAALGSDTRYASLQLSAGPPGHDVMSVTREGVALPMNASPYSLFNQLFGEDADQKHVAYLLESNRSVLDFVLEDARRLERRVSAADRDKLDEYLTSLRAVEQDLARQHRWLDVPKPRIDAPPPASATPASAQMFEAAKSMYDLMALALATDSARVMTLYFPTFSPVFTLDGQRLVAGYHGLSHHNNDPLKVRDLIKIDTLHMQLFAGFLEQLAQKRDAEGRPLLDSTVVLLGSGMGDGSRHSNQNVPALVAGGGMRHGLHVDHRAENGESPEGGPVLSNLFVTLLRACGVERDTFANSNGDMSHVLS